MWFQPGRAPRRHLGRIVWVATRLGQASCGARQPNLAFRPIFNIRDEQYRVLGG